MGKLVGYARVSTRGQDADRQMLDLAAAGVLETDLHVDTGFSGSRARRPALDRALAELEPGDTFVVTTLDRLGRSTINMLELATRLRGQGVGLRVLNLGGGDVDTSTPMGSMVFTVMAALAEMELEIKKERMNDSITKRRLNGGNLGGRPEKFTDTQIRMARDLVNSGQRTITQVAAELGMSRPTYYKRVAELNARDAAALAGTSTGGDYYAHLGRLDAETITAED